MKNAMLEFRKGLELGVFSVHDHRDHSHAVFTVFEGPRPDQATLKGLIATGARAQGFAITSRFSRLEEIGAWVARVSARTEAARAIGRLPDASFVVETDGRRVRVIVQPDLYDADNFALALVDENSGCLIATIGARRFAEGFSLLQLFVAVVALVVIVSGAVLIVSIAKGNRTSAGGKIEVNEEDMVIEGDFESEPIVKPVPEGQ